jgi:cytochrome c peroxidase
MHFLNEKKIKFSAMEDTFIQSLQLKKKDPEAISKERLQKQKLGEFLFTHKWKNRQGFNLSCKNCHNTINLPVNFPHKLKFDPPPLVDMFESKWLGWTGTHRTQTQWREKFTNPLFNSKEHNLTQSEFETQLKHLGIEGGREEFELALKEYLLAQKTKFTRFDEGLNRLTASETRGLKVFVGKGKCILCHNGPRLSNEAFHNIGVPLNDEQSTHRYIENNMEGRVAGTHRTPCLRCTLTYPPYFHNGAYVTLNEVIEHYNKAPEGVVGETEIGPLNLQEIEKRDLLSFLRIFVHE